MFGTMFMFQLTYYGSQNTGQKQLTVHKQLKQNAHCYAPLLLYFWVTLTVSVKVHVCVLENYKHVQDIVYTYYV